jgi:class 3 adenylate cyclase/tetratricopeptide (TPR) repeat protein
MDIGGWLHELGLDRYEPAFRAKAVDLADLPGLTTDDLKDLGVRTVGDRRKLFTAIAKLDGGSPAPAAAPERRQLTVFVCDLVGSTALAVNSDPEDLRAILAAFIRCCVQEVRRRGGFVAKIMGDGLLAFFGYPEAHERDAELAVETGLAVVAAVPKLETPAGAPLHVRVGVATGLVVVGDLLKTGRSEERGIVGSAPHIAERLQAIAEPDTVVISNDTRGFLGELYDLRDLGAHDLKGLDTPTRAWAVLARSAVESRFEALRGAKLSAFVGRKSETGRLIDLWEAARSGRGQVVVLSGEAGVSKSRLTAEGLRRIADESQLRLRYYCSPHHRESAFHPILRQMERMAGFNREDSCEAKRAKLNALLARGATPPEDAALFADMLSLADGGREPPDDGAPDRRRRMVMRALLGLTERVARERPTVIVLEDAQWADPSTLEHLGRLVDRVGGLRVLLLIVCRPEFEAPWIGKPSVTSIALGRLTGGEIGALIDNVVGEAPLPTEARAEIVRKADGLPLFAEEIAKAALEMGADAARTPAATSVPASLQASLMARLDRLGPAKEVAQIAAAIGRECAHALLVAAAAEGVADLDAALDDLVAAGLLIPRGQPPDAVYVFKHALLQDLAYGALLRERKRALHARIAQAMETLFPGIGENQPETLARHCFEAGAVEKAAGLWGRAGRKCLRNSALREAETHFSRALELIRGRPNAPALRLEEITCQMGLARTLLLLRGYTSGEARAVLQRTIALIEPAGGLEEPVEHRLALFTTLHGFWLASVAASSGAATREMAAQCLQLAQKGGGQGERVAGHHALGLSLMFSGDVLAGRAHFDQAIAMFDPSEDRQATRYGGEYWSSALAGRAAALWTLGYPDGARVDAAQSLQSARMFGHAMTLGNNLVFAAWTHFACGHFDVAGSHAAELRALANETGQSFYRAFSLMMEGVVAIAKGGSADAAQETSGALAAYRATGATLLTAHVLACLAEALAREGRFEEARLRLDEAAATMAATEERWCESDIRRITGEVALMGPARDVSAAERDFEQALAIAREQGAKSWELRAATSLARLRRADGRSTEARACLEPVYRWFTEGFDTCDLIEAGTLLGELTN